MNFPVRLIAAFGIAALAGCASDLPQADLPATPPAFREAAFSGGITLAPSTDGRWWTIFADPVLDDLIARSDNGNTNIQQAAARFAQAQALVRTVAAAQWPQINGAANASQQTGTLVNAAGATGTLLNIGANLTYELDFLGRLSKAEDAAKLDAQSRESLLKAARLLAESDVAQTYFLLREVDEERALLRSTGATYKETLAVKESSRRAGLDSDLSVARARAELGSVEIDTLALDRRRAELEHALAVLVGETPETFQLGTATTVSVLPLVPSGIPASVLSRRPDVLASAYAVDAAGIRIGLAQEAWFPTLSLTASGGYASPTLSDLLKSSAGSFGVAGLLAAPLFDGGRREAGVRSATADLQLAQGAYRERILVALKEVEDQLTNLRILADQSDVIGITVDADARVTAQLESRQTNGLASRLEVLDAHRTELKDRRTALQIQSARYIATVVLVRALGGGWDSRTAQNVR